jgi:hypothetical protein
MWTCAQYVEGMKLVTYALMDAMNGKAAERAMAYYVSCASDVVMELVRKVHKVCTCLIRSLRAKWCLCHLRVTAVQ